MALRLQIRHEASGAWSLSGLPRCREVNFDDLAGSLAFAKRQCDAQPTLIELISDGVYVAAYQSEGWPEQLCRPRPIPYRARVTRIPPHHLATLRGLCWLGRLFRFHVKDAAAHNPLPTHQQRPR